MSNLNIIGINIMTDNDGITVTLSTDDGTFERRIADGEPLYFYGTVAWQYEQKGPLTFAEVRDDFAYSGRRGYDEFGEYVAKKLVLFERGEIVYKSDTPILASIVGGVFRYAYSSKDQAWNMSRQPSVEAATLQRYGYVRTTQAAKPANRVYFVTN